MKKYEITEEIVNGLLNYLKSKPYEEVVKGIQTLLQLKEISKENGK